VLEEVTMSAQEIGKKLVAFCKAGQNIESIKTLYADNVESVEAVAAPGGSRVTRGKDAVLTNNVKWLEAHEVHSAVTEGPYPHGDDKFAVRFTMDVTNKANGQHLQLDEVAVYTLERDKVVREEFFYSAG
jgi:SnoaL-like domain